MVLPFSHTTPERSGIGVAVVAVVAVTGRINRGVVVHATPATKGKCSRPRIACGRVTTIVAIQRRAENSKFCLYGAKYAERQSCNRRQSMGGDWSPGLCRSAVFIANIDFRLPYEVRADKVGVHATHKSKWTCWNEGRCKSHPDEVELPR